jgi:hypothetical protein
MQTITEHLFGVLILFLVLVIVFCRLTKKAEPRRAKNREPRSGTASANRRWLRRLVEPSRFAADLAEMLRSFRVHRFGW